MPNTAKENSLDINSLTNNVPLAKSLFEHWGGVPLEIVPPEWPQEGEEDMAVCMRNVLVPFSQNVGAIKLENLLNNHDCIPFFAPEEALEWLPIFMCGCLYAIDIIHDKSELIVEWTEYLLERCIDSGQLLIPRRTLVEFCEHMGFEKCLDKLRF